MNIREADKVDKEALEEGERKKFPNPLFYGEYLGSDFKWAKLYPQSSNRQKSAPLGNLAIVYLESPLYQHNHISFPEITSSDPGKFMNLNETVVVKAIVYGWCEGQIKDNEKFLEPNLTMTTINVTACSQNFGT